MRYLILLALFVIHPAFAGYEFSWGGNYQIYTTTNDCNEVGAAMARRNGGPDASLDGLRYECDKPQVTPNVEIRVYRGSSLLSYGTPYFINKVGPNMSPIREAVRFESVITALLVIAGLVAVLFVARRGALLVLSLIRRGRS